MRKFDWKRALVLLGIVAQLTVPSWMLLKYHLILTRGEKVTLNVTMRDPRDLFMGHYVRLTTQKTPSQLEGIKENYLRYYCDQRYALELERAVSGRIEAKLEVRVWRGSALAEALLIDGLPAYMYVQRQREQSVAKDSSREILGQILYADRSSVTDSLKSEKYMREEMERLATAGVTHLFVGEGIEAVWFQYLSNDGKLLPKTNLPHPFWREKLLNGELQVIGDPLVPRQRDALKEHAKELFTQIDYSDGMIPVVPVFGRPYPVGTKADFMKQAQAYYEAVQAVYRKHWGVMVRKMAFIGVPTEVSAKDVQTALLKAFPGADWFLPYNGGELPDVANPQHVILLVCGTPPIDTKGMRWIAVKDERSDKSFPKGAVGRAYSENPLIVDPGPRELAERLLAELKTNATLVAQEPWREAYVRAMAGVAATHIAQTQHVEARVLAELKTNATLAAQEPWREAYVGAMAGVAATHIVQTQHEEARVLAERLMLYVETMTLRQYYDEMDSFAEYRLFLDRLADPPYAGRLLFLGGLSRATRQAGILKEPVRVLEPNAKNMIETGEAILAL